MHIIIFLIASFGMFIFGYKCFIVSFYMACALYMLMFVRSYLFISISHAYKYISIIQLFFFYYSFFIVLICNYIFICHLLKRNRKVSFISAMLLFVHGTCMYSRVHALWRPNVSHRSTWCVQCMYMCNLTPKCLILFTPKCPLFLTKNYDATKCPN